MGCRPPLDADEDGSGLCPEQVGLSQLVRAEQFPGRQRVGEVLVEEEHRPVRNILGEGPVAALTLDQITLLVQRIQGVLKALGDDLQKTEFIVVEPVRGSSAYYEHTALPQRDVRAALEARPVYAVVDGAGIGVRMGVARVEGGPERGVSLLDPGHRPDHLTVDGAGPHQHVAVPQVHGGLLEAEGIAEGIGDNRRGAGFRTHVEKVPRHAVEGAKALLSHFLVGHVGSHAGEPLKSPFVVVDGIDPCRKPPAAPGGMQHAELLVLRPAWFVGVLGLDVGAKGREVCGMDVAGPGTRVVA